VHPTYSFTEYTWFSPADTTPPVVVCPAGITVEAEASSGTAATLQAITDFLAGSSATDVVDSSPTLTNDMASLDPWPLGVTTTTFTATDDAGNEATCTATVTVTGGILAYRICVFGWG
jgi:hypothetical protein